MQNFQKILPQQSVFHDTNFDAFARLRVSNPYTLFDGQNRFALSNVFFSNIQTGGSVINIVAENTANLVTIASACVVTRQSKYYFPYQPGKSLLFIGSFCMYPKQTGLTQRVGYFDDMNGIYFELSDSTMYIVKRNAGTNLRIAQQDWNSNKLSILDPSNVQLFFVDIEWLGVGTVRCGFFMHGFPVICHKFHHANQTNGVYMTTACLPVRYQIINSGTAPICGLKQICSTVLSEGGYESRNSSAFSQKTGAISFTTGTTKPAISIRLKQGYQGAIVYLRDIFCAMTTANDVGFWFIYKNATLTGASFTNHASSFNVDIDITATTISGGVQVDGGIFTSSQSITNNFEKMIQLGLTDTYTSEVLTLAVSGINSGSSQMVVGLQWIEI
jgi:hypothetical protein